ncbi:MAG: hypothetical protein R3F17_13665 [Planctomycetota bacterium]
MENLLVKLFKTPETRERVYRTLLLLVVYRLGFQVPIPGTNAAFLQSTADQGIMGMLSALSGGAIGQTTVFALGIMPYISASIIFSMLTKVSPALEAVSKERRRSERINQWTPPRGGPDCVHPSPADLHRRLHGEGQRDAG